MEADDFVIVEKKDVKKASSELKYRGKTADFCGGIDQDEIISDLEKVGKYDLMIEQALNNPTEVTHILGEDQGGLISVKMRILRQQQIFFQI